MQREEEDSLIAALNRDCQCITVDEARLERELESSPATTGLYRSIRENQPNLFASSPVFVTRAHVDRMQAAIDAVYQALAIEAVRDEILSWAPPIARIDNGPQGVFLGFDFHLGPDGPRLIEINTNAGGALLNTALARAQRACCAEVEAMVAGALGSESQALEDEFVAMFREEWRLAGRSEPLARIAIVDDEPTGQYLHAEFLLFRRLFEAAGIDAVVVDPRELRDMGNGLDHAGQRIDLVYNRLTDFALEGEASRALREAYVRGDVVLTPHPRAHALFADKRNLALFSDRAQLHRLGVPGAVVEELLRVVPPTFVVDPAQGARLWERRKTYFWKPVAGFGSKAAYRGDKLTRGTFERILAEPYVAQEIVPPSQRTIEVVGELIPLKLDLRSYVYAARIQLVAARLYRGQTTNFRTPGGGFAPVFTRVPDQAA